METEFYPPEVKDLGFIAGVGSRHVPEFILELMIRLGRTKADLGYKWSSGDAYGSDRAFIVGARQSVNYNLLGARIYLAQDGNNRRWAREHPFYYDATTFVDTYTHARGMACAARGGWNGVGGEWGMKQHTRNVYQIHGHTLLEPVKEIWYYGVPSGNPANEFVKGGTNTALQLAKMANVPVRKNLYFREVQEEAERWLLENESDEAYDDIDWADIHDPRDPRLTEF